MSKTKYKAAPIIISLALFVIYFIVLFKITIFRGSNSGVRNVNLIPFITVAENLQSILRGNKFIGISNLFGNLIMFLPLGYMTSLLFPKMRKIAKILMLAIAFSLAIEALQYIFVCGRSDIDDVIMNTLGGAAGYCVYIFISRLTKQKKYSILISASMIAVTCIGFFTFDNYKFLVVRPAPGNIPVRAERHNNGFTEPFTIDERPDAHLSIEAVANTDFNAVSNDDTLDKEDEPAWYLILVNKWNCVPDDYVVELTELSNGELVDKRIYTALKKMFDEARNDGIYPIVVSGYRTSENQQRIMDEKIADYKAEGYSDEETAIKAEAWVAVPGTSEHQLGIAVDINADGIYSAGYEVYEWLAENACKYGFICRYPPDKTEITGVINEPWHYRYVGIEAATEIQNQGICLEEYLDKM